MLRDKRWLNARLRCFVGVVPCLRQPGISSAMSRLHMSFTSTSPALLYPRDLLLLQRCQPLSVPEWTHLLSRNRNQTVVHFAEFGVGRVRVVFLNCDGDDVGTAKYVREDVRDYVYNSLQSCVDLVCVGLFYVSWFAGCQRLFALKRGHIEHQ